MTKKKKQKDPGQDLPEFHLSQQEFWYLQRLHDVEYFIVLLNPWIWREFQLAGSDIDEYPFRNEITRDEYPVIRVAVDLQ